MRTGFVLLDLFVQAHEIHPALTAVDVSEQRPTMLKRNCTIYVGESYREACDGLTAVLG